MRVYTENSVLVVLDYNSLRGIEQIQRFIKMFLLSSDTHPVALFPQGSGLYRAKKCTIFNKRRPVITWASDTIIAYDPWRLMAMFDGASKSKYGLYTQRHVKGFMERCLDARKRNVKDDVSLVEVDALSKDSPELLFLTNILSV